MALAISVACRTAPVRVPLRGTDRRLGRGGLSRQCLYLPSTGTSVTHGHRNCYPNKLLNIAQEGHLLALAKGNRDAFHARASRTADTVHVGFRHIRQIKVDDVADAIDIDSARGDIGGNEGPDLALTKGGENALALVLRFIAVNCFGADASSDQATHDLVGAMLGSCEDQGTVNRFSPQHVDQDCRLCGTIDANDALLDAFNGRGGRRYRDLDRVAQHLHGEFGDGTRQGGRKHQRLPLDRKHTDNLTDIMDKAHVEHPVGFVENEPLDLAQSERIVFDKIKQPARRGDENIRAIEQRANLPTHRHTAYRQRGSKAQVAAVRAEGIEDLAQQFAGRAEHQDSAALARQRARAAGETVQNR